MFAGALLAGFVTGLAGFGTGLTALGIWLHVVEPAVAAALVVICSVVGQLQGLRVIRSRMNWVRLRPFLLGGLAGVPFGVAALSHVDAEPLKLAVGVLLVGYSGLMLGVRRFSVIDRPGTWADGAAGFGGGFLGGLAGLSGPLVTIWVGLRGYDAHEQRTIYQPFNLGVLLMALLVYLGSGLLTTEVCLLAALCIPGTILGGNLGVRCYGRLSERQFRGVVLSLLMVLGLTLVLAGE